MPAAFRRSEVFGPIPGTSPHGEAANRAQACSRLRTTNPPGFSASEATFATSRLGPTPIEQLSEVLLSISARISRIVCSRSGSSVSSR